MFTAFSFKFFVLSECSVLGLDFCPFDCVRIFFPRKQAELVCSFADSPRSGWARTDPTRSCLDVDKEGAFCIAWHKPGDDSCFECRVSCLGEAH